MLRTPLPIFLILLSAYACNKPRPTQGSAVANFTIDELKTKDGMPSWEQVAVTMNRLKPNPGLLSNQFKRSSFGSGKVEDVSMKVEYGTYEIGLFYSDAKQKVLYQVCADEKDKRYEINQPKFQTPIKICQATDTGGESSVGEVTIKPSADVTINPALYDPDGSSGVAGTGNPFAGASLYINPEYAALVMAAAARESSDLGAKMQKISRISTAIWLDRIAKIKDFSKILAAAQAEKAKSGGEPLVTFVVYDLPERDCAAYSSAGELKGASGLATYKTQYIDEIAKLLKQYKDLRFAAIIEPDSLPNMATNMGVSKCVAAAPLYKEGVAYAIKALALPHVALYLDAAHGGWLGWPDNRTKMASIFKEVLELAGGSHLIRGFASNVSNYSPLTMAQPDPNPDSYYQSNPARDELTFTKLLAQDLKAAGLKNVNFVIDTSRNGKARTRKVWGSWCNVKGAGLGARPAVAPAAGIDAYIWVKPPGESDGISDASKPRFDPMCTSEDSMSNAPQAGEWFQDQFKALVLNASPAL